MTSIRKILIANRGEIAVRIIRACNEMDIRTVAVFSDTDRKALHVLMSDEAYHIGASPAAESYLRIDKIIDTARRSGADAIHPGYGFLAENAAFARACEDSGMTLIGPNSHSMEAMGSKTHARRLMQQAGVPMVPGTVEGIEDAGDAARIAASFGYPVMIKAAAGGGGKGMRKVSTPAEIAASLREAQSEAKNAFGNSEVYIEKLIENPRHIEIQVLGDRHGNMVYLGERECSVQRRHQKVVEECPSPLIDPVTRRKMGEAAVKAALAADYYNAGTVEFLADSEKNFYFLEMNTRLQVEHPVTEMVTGLDLVKLQIRVAAGEKLPFSQGDVVLRGAAIECRVYAEDPENGFFPSPGLITSLETPSGPGVRDDSGVYSGWTVPTEYDPLISKLVAWGADRDEAIARMKRALGEYHVSGIKTNIALFREILDYPEFIAGNLDTGILDRIFAARKNAGGATPEKSPRMDEVIPAIVAVVLSGAKRRRPESNGCCPKAAVSRWKSEGRQILHQHSD